MLCAIIASMLAWEAEGEPCDRTSQVPMHDLGMEKNPTVVAAAANLWYIYSAKGERVVDEIRVETCAHCCPLP